MYWFQNNWHLPQTYQIIHLLLFVQILITSLKKLLEKLFIKWVLYYFTVTFIPNNIASLFAIINRILILL